MNNALESCHCVHASRAQALRNEVKRGNLTTLGFVRNKVFSKPNSLQTEFYRDCFVVPPRNDKSYYCHCERSAAERGNLATVGFANNRVFNKPNKMQTKLYRDCFIGNDKRGGG